MLVYQRVFYYHFLYWEFEMFSLAMQGSKIHATETRGEQT